MSNRIRTQQADGCVRRGLWRSQLQVSVWPVEHDGVHCCAVVGFLRRVPAQQSNTICNALRSARSTCTIFGEPDSRRARVVLMRPGFRGVDSFAVHLQPLPHGAQSLFEDGRDPTVLRRTNVHQQVSSATAKKIKYYFETTFLTVTCTFIIIKKVFVLKPDCFSEDLRQVVHCEEVGEIRISSVRPSSTIDGHAVFPLVLLKHP